MYRSPCDDERLASARSELRRGYLLVSFGCLEAALDACRRADELLDGEHHLPRTLAGNFMLSAGEVTEALRVLRTAIAAHPEEALPRAHFAEACFVDGRMDRGEHALSEARVRDDGTHRKLIAALEETWVGVEAEEIPPPLEVAA